MYYVDGAWYKPDEPAIFPEDRGYQFGDGIYEVVRIYNGHLYQWDDHMIRLERSAKELSLTIPSRKELTDIAQKVLKQHLMEFSEDAILYMQITRGVSDRQFPFPSNIRPILTMYATSKLRPIQQMQNGISAVLVDDIRWLRCDIKSLNLLGASWAKQQAVEQRVDEAILHRSGTITEATSANLFAVKDGKIYTHPATNLILHGITRQTVIQLAKNLDLPVLEEAFSVNFAQMSDELFITGTTSEITPIVELQGAPVGDGKVGSIVRRLQKAFEDHIAT
ncbi:D-amino-acid transaminase [Brevibacillus laterosporus]|uniref:D-alanine aminotransferase n=1 Tax=Brevibacillus laterosporus TaxID=1465 RepID=A0AAP3GDP8_BRELA|nr:D-amino-acid transaminase [Brevibacillus laterosporus]MCR8981254.1 D-amino-acid transaminase [Brevibacillus laterosporus]MCZ0808409.1 D-amino-acid transaminase [Brevibacillus laterosporus]MCZ0826667.1 D-amino-acid transaminase [Brevibacillus laterosporus]MCZ0850480.1 D-amino-acid transaminase [Brevibacillus laterosporus]MED1663936.1 D-amino-acid transaminase [Brevibacillus laterosporus]